MSTRVHNSTDDLQSMCRTTGFTSRTFLLLDSASSYNPGTPKFPRVRSRGCMISGNLYRNQSCLTSQALEARLSLQGFVTPRAPLLAITYM
jgi:hypothetical protein